MLKRSGIQFPAVDIAFHATECSVFPFDTANVSALCALSPQEEGVSTTIVCVTVELSLIPCHHCHSCLFLQGLVAYWQLGAILGFLSPEKAT